MNLLDKNIEKLKSIRNWISRFLRHYIGGIFHQISEQHVFLMGGGLAFSLIICIVPMVLIIFSGLGMILERPSIADEINGFIDRAIPYQQYADTIKDIVLTRIQEFRIYKGIAGVIGLIGLLIASSGLFSSMRTILNSVYKQPPNGSVLVDKLWDIGMIVLVMFYFLLSTLILPGLDIFTGVIRNLDTPSFLNIDLLLSYLVELISFGIIFVAFFIIYLTVPRSRISWSATAVSALAAAIMWEIAKQGFGFYITEVATYKRVYGAYAIFIVVVFWIYYSSIVFILGGIIGQLYRERNELGSG